ncbi:CASP-like protein 4B4 isoform X2 [Brachypodium distachyon]|uniref:CASP-like protein n=1 Tax=Brachypodium distachyon TaxID=15368 RepID=A0A2K2DB83_BRADI|nr:CASP-like protein 4B4 isoform X2 [Brachypodium distachyon]PNT71528.1 hypothetical protein BRADI_2g30390v3 [Brachypodium distachyon]|eukprot:XP_014753925.1 CASP-like protein 4B4 isoform X2 [Brachypodium distachyon]
MADAPAADPEKAGTHGSAGGDDASGGGAVAAVVGRWRRQDLLEKSGSALRAAAWALSLLSFLVMAANEHGDWKQFDHYEEYRYIVAVGLLAFIYTTLQLVRHGVRLTGGQDLQSKAGLLVDFAGDQANFPASASDDAHTHFIATLCQFDTCLLSCIEHWSRCLVKIVGAESQ